MSDSGASATRPAGAGPAVVLVGPPGAGKSTVGRLLSERLGVPFRDTDSDIEARAGKPISDIFLDDGEPAFRSMEREAVAAALAQHAGVLALGGGAVMDDGTRVALRGHRVVYLSVDVRSAARRVGLARDRPVLAINPRQQLHALLLEREPLYAEVAGLVIDTSARNPQAVADEVAAWL